MITSTRRNGIAALAFVLVAVTGACSPYKDAYDAQTAPTTPQPTAVPPGAPSPNPAIATPAPPTQSTSAAPSGATCPDSKYMRLYIPPPSGASGSGAATTWVPSTPCEAAIIKAAMDYCTWRTGTSDNIVEGVTRAEDVTSSLLVASEAAASIAGAVFGSKTAAIASAAALLTTLSGDLKNLPSLGTPPSQPSATQMMGAAQSYAQENQDLIVPDPSKNGKNPFYAGLWNAVGAQCPNSLLAGNFKMTKVDSSAKYTYWTHGSASIAYGIGAGDNADSIAQTIGAKVAAAIPGTSSPVSAGKGTGTVTFTVPQQIQGVALTATQQPTSALEKANFTLGTPVNGQATTVTLAVSTQAKVTAGDAILVSATWAAQPAPGPVASK